MIPPKLEINNFSLLQVTGEVYYFGNIGLVELIFQIIPIFLQIFSLLSISGESLGCVGSADSTATRVESKSTGSTFTTTLLSSSFLSSGIPLDKATSGLPDFTGSTKFDGKRPWI